MIIFGWGNRHIKDFGSTLIQTCSICSQENYFHLVRVRDWFDLFFIPVFPYNTEYHLMCPRCEGAYKLEDEEQIETLKDMAELIENFNEKEITKKEAQKEYEKLVKKLSSCSS